MSVRFLDLPIELILNILSFTVDVHPIPSSILCVNNFFFQICQPLLHTHLSFRSTWQLESFCSNSLHTLTSPPRSLNVELAGGSVNYEVFKCLREVLLRCSGASNSGGRLPNVLRLRLNSHASDPNLGSIYDALSLAE
jgi:hypothetical protein